MSDGFLLPHLPVGILLDNEGLETTCRAHSLTVGQVGILTVLPSAHELAYVPEAVRYRLLILLETRLKFL